MPQRLIFLPQKRRARAHQKLARGLSLQVVLEMPRVARVRHTRRVHALMHAIPVQHAIHVEILQETNVVLKHPLISSARQPHAAHRRLKPVRRPVFFHVASSHL